MTGKPAGDGGAGHVGQRNRFTSSTEALGLQEGDPRGGDEVGDTSRAPQCPAGLGNTNCS